LHGSLLTWVCVFPRACRNMLSVSASALSTTGALPSAGAADGLAYVTAACPPGLAWVEKKTGYKNSFHRWVNVGGVVEVVLHHNDKRDPTKNSYFRVQAADIRAKGDGGFATLCCKRYQSEQDVQERLKKARVGVEQVQHGAAANLGHWRAMKQLAKDGEATAQALVDDAADAHAELGGNGVQPPIPQPNAVQGTHGQCDICFCAFTAGIMQMPCCNFMSCAKCYLKHAQDRDTCPGGCNKPLPAVAAPQGLAPADDLVDDDDSVDDDGITCIVCKDDCDLDGDRLLNCTKTGCSFSIHQKCCDPWIVNLDYENDECWCNKHKRRQERGDHLIIEPSSGKYKPRATKLSRPSERNAGAGSSSNAAPTNAAGSSSTAPPFWHTQWGKKMKSAARTIEAFNAFRAAY